jgi:hypothetical protein
MPVRGVTLWETASANACYQEAGDGRPA